MDSRSIADRQVTEQEAKAELLVSIARSQHALARILESIADVAGQSRETALCIGKNIAILTKLQAVMSEEIAVLKQRRDTVYNSAGLPAAPWLNPRLHGSLKPFFNAKGDLPHDGKEKKSPCEGCQANRTKEAKFTSAKSKKPAERRRFHPGL